MNIQKKNNPFDRHLTNIADYVIKNDVGKHALAMDTARYCLMDSLACAMLALAYPACTKMLGPVVEGANLPGGARVPGTAYELDPIQAAFNIGALIRWLDYNDTWLAAEWGHPSDNLGGILAVADYISRRNRNKGQPPLKMRSVLQAAIKAHEIQGILALENAFNRVGLDHVLLVRIASCAVVAHLFGATRDEILNALSNAWLDGCALRAYRHAPNAGSRKSWAAGDATARAVRLALIASTGEMGYPSVLSTPVWGFEDALMRGAKIKRKRPYRAYVMENVLFKISYPAEFHAQTAVEAGVELHSQVQPRLNDIKEIVIETQEAGKRIIDKQGALNNPADRDHCIQYMTAVALLRGKLTAEDYEGRAAANPAIDKLRARMQVRENPNFTKDYFDENKRAIPNAVQVFFKDGTKTKRIQVDYPIGHKRRRKEGIPLLKEKFTNALATRLSAKKCALLETAFASRKQLEKMAVDDLMELLTVPC